MRLVIGFNPSRRPLHLPQLVAIPVPDLKEGKRTLRQKPKKLVSRKRGLPPSPAPRSSVVLVSGWVLGASSDEGLWHRCPADPGERKICWRLRHRFCGVRDWGFGWVRTKWLNLISGWKTLQKNRIGWSVNERLNGNSTTVLDWMPYCQKLNLIHLTLNNWAISICHGSMPHSLWLNSYKRGNYDHNYLLVHTIVSYCITLLNY